MSHHEPGPKELSVLRKIDGKMRRMDVAKTRLRELGADRFLEDDEYSGDMLHWHIHIGHAIEGVRTNGTEQTTTLANFKLAARRIRKGFAAKRADINNAMTDLDVILAEIETLMKPFVVCAKCKGLRGRYVPDSRHSYIRGWEDCDRCDGRGVIYKEVNLELSL